MNKEDNRKWIDKDQTKEATGSSAQLSDAGSAADASDVVKDENIPVTYINTAPDVPTKDSPDTSKK